MMDEFHFGKKKLRKAYFEMSSEFNVEWNNNVFW